MTRLRRLVPWLVLLLILAAAGGALVLVSAGILVLPPRYDPWAPLDISEEPGFLTRYKLSRLEGEPARCHAALAPTALRFTPQPDRPAPADGPNQGCSLTGTVRVDRSGVAFNGGFVATCPVAAAWMLFEIHALQPAARKHFGQPVARVRHLGTYACRNLYNRESGRRSEHATANAIDIAAFVLKDGTQISLLRDWREPEKTGPEAAEAGPAGGDARRAAFLREIRDGACRFFDVVLGPEYNEAHRDHFHFDMGGFRSCR